MCACDCTPYITKAIVASCFQPDWYSYTNLLENPKFQLDILIRVIYSYKKAYYYNKNYSEKQMYSPLYSNILSLVYTYKTEAEASFIPHFWIAIFTSLASAL